MNKTDHSLDWVTFTDNDDEVPCDMLSGCTQVATHTVQGNCCPHIENICMKHIAAIQAIVARSGYACHWYGPGACKGDATEFTFTPIKG